MIGAGRSAKAPCPRRAVAPRSHGRFPSSARRDDHADRLRDRGAGLTPEVFTPSTRRQVAVLAAPPRREPGRRVAPAVESAGKITASTYGRTVERIVAARTWPLLTPARATKPARRRLAIEAPKLQRCSTNTGARFGQDRGRRLRRDDFVEKHATAARRDERPTNATPRSRPLRLPHPPAVPSPRPGRRQAALLTKPDPMDVARHSVGKAASSWLYMAAPSTPGDRRALGDEYAHGHAQAWTVPDGRAALPGHPAPRQLYDWP